MATKQQIIEKMNKDTAKAFKAAKSSKEKYLPSSVYHSSFKKIKGGGPDKRDSFMKKLDSAKGDRAKNHTSR